MTGPKIDPPAPDDDRTALLRDDDPVPMMTSASWDQAEAKLYPAVTTRPDLYQRVLTIVARTVEHLRGLGWQEELLGSDQDMHGCDLLFTQPPERAAGQDDPSFIRRPSVQLWGEEAQPAAGRVSGAAAPG